MGSKENTESLRSKDKVSKEMSTVRKSNKKVIAILTSDWHLSDRPPIARSVEPDWYAVMRRTLDQLSIFQREHDDCPIIVAGDIFDRWTNPPKLINWLIDVMPQNVHAIPGQHDLKNHSYQDLDETSYMTLYKAGAISSNLKPASSMVDIIPGWIIRGFPWDIPIVPYGGSLPSLAVIHKYVWKKGCSYPGASINSKASNQLESVKGYDATVWGDNHKGFKFHQIFNCGTLMRRKIDEKDYIPQIGLLHESGDITSQPLWSEDELKIDKFINLDSVGKMVDSLDLKDFVSALSTIDMNKKFIDFRDAVKEFCESNNIGTVVRNILSEVME